jgi:CspA family cold shock protein
MPKGKVKWFNRERRYGFITQEDGKEIFFHQNEVVNKMVLEEGQEVEFEVARGPKGPYAVSVRPVR